jgi:hypothetical protein
VCLCGTARQKGELSHLNQPHTLAAHDGIKQIYVCFGLICKSKRGLAAMLRVSPLQIAYNNNTQHRRYIHTYIEPLQKRLRLLIRDKTGNTIHGVLECGAAHTNRKTPLNMFIASFCQVNKPPLSRSEYTLNVNNHLGVVLFFNLQKPLMCVYMCVALIRRKNTLPERERGN